MGVAVSRVLTFAPTWAFGPPDVDHRDDVERGTMVGRRRRLTRGQVERMPVHPDSGLEHRRLRTGGYAKTAATAIATTPLTSEADDIGRC
jgi:hypothetical protein